MKIGLYGAISGSRLDAQTLQTLGVGAELREFHSLWIPDHALHFDSSVSRHPYALDGSFPDQPEQGFADPFTSLTFVAAHTSRLRLGTGVCVLPQRNPVHVAKAAASLDRLSGMPSGRDNRRSAEQQS